MSRYKILAYMIAIFLFLPMNTLSTESAHESNVIKGPNVSFVNVTEQAGISGINANSFSWGDYNNDGYEDLLVRGQRLFRNNGPPNWDFTEVTAQAGLKSGTSGGVWGDYDNDGFLDIYSFGRSIDILYHNNGDGTFTDVTVQAGNIKDDYPTVAAGWGDYDRDGYIDLYVCNGEDWNNGNPIYYPNFLYHNNGDGTFTNITSQAGVDDSSNPRYSRGVQWGDFNNDGWLDIHVSNYRLSPNYLYINNRNGTFKEVAKEKNCAGVYDPYRYEDKTAAQYYGRSRWGPTYGHTIGSSWADYDNDGDMDIWDSNLVHKYVGKTNWPSMPYDIRGYLCDDSKLYRNNGAPYYNFTDMRNQSGIPIKPIGGMGTYKGDELFSGVAWGDFDNDGDLDLWIPQVYDIDYAYSFLYEQDGIALGHFTDRANELNIRVWNTYAGSWCDYDNDGDLDLLTAGKSPYVGQGQGKYEIHLFRNSGNSNHYLKFKLKGTESNTFAIGARVKVVAGNLTMIREVEGGMGCNGHQNSMILHFGLGKFTKADVVEIKWPNGRLQFLYNISADQILNLTEPSDPLPEIKDVSVSPKNPAEDEEVCFTATIDSNGATIKKILWDIDADGNFDISGNTVKYKYTTSGLKHVRLRVITGTDGGVEYYPIEFTVRNIPPTAEFMCNLTCAEDEITYFDASGSTDTESDIKVGLVYRWDFGDGTTINWSESYTASHKYQTQGEYAVNLSVMDDDGYISSVEKVITVLNLPPSVEKLEDITCYEDDDVKFTANATDTPSDIENLRYMWDFGDGTKSKWSDSPTTKHRYVKSGNYTAKLTVMDDDMVKVTAEQKVRVLNPIPKCSITSYTEVVDEDELFYLEGNGEDNPSDEKYIEFMWDFGDGTNTSWMKECSAQHIYTNSGNYTVTLYIKDDDDINFTSVNITVKNVPPTCRIITEDVESKEDEIIEFEGEGKDSSSDIQSLLYSWDFGDGNRSIWSKNKTVEHKYTNEGDYEVRLYVRDDDGDTAVSKSISVYVENVPPIASGEASDYIVYEGERINFTALGTVDTESDMNTLKYHWDFGDKTSAEGMNVSHTYYVSKKYKVTLTVTDDDGEFGTITLRTIIVKNIPPTAVITVNITNATVGQNIYFSADNSTCSPWETDNITYRWSFGDGTTSTDVNLTHVFRSPGIYTVTLFVNDGDDTATCSITIRISESEYKKAHSEKDVENNFMFYFATAVGVAILIVITSTLIIIRKKKKEQNPPEMY